MSITEARLDAMEIASFHGKLRDVEAEVDRWEYPDQPFADSKLVYIDIQNKPEFKTSVYHQVTHQGGFQLARNYTTNIPRIDFLVNEIEQKIYKWISGYDYTDDDMLAVMRHNMSISTEKIYGVKEAYRQILNRLIAYGDRSINMPGFVNHPDVLRSKSPYDLDGTSSPSQKLGVLNDAFNAPVVLTENVEKPDTLLLPLSRFIKCSNELISTPDGLINKTVLKHFLETNPYCKNIEPLTELEAHNLQKAGLGNKPLAIAYCRDPRKVKAKIYMPMRFLDARREGVDGWVRPAKFKFAGVQFRRPWSCHVIELPNSY